MALARFDRTRVLDVSDPRARARRELALELAEAALDAVEPERATRAAIERLARAEPLEGATLFAFGKAAIPMVRAAREALSLRGGVVIAREAVELAGLDVRLGGHPDPAPDALEVGREVLARAAALGERDVALCLVSGGGSAMLELPMDAVSLDEVRALAKALMRAGADIAELNAVRRALSRLKGGGLARAMAPARVCNVILSDVPGHPPSIVASGPTCAPPEDAPEPRAVLERYGLWRELSPKLRAAIERRRDPVSTVIRTEIAADNTTARAAVVARAAALGLEMEDRAGFFRGEAREVGASIAPSDRAWVWGGETTVTVRGSGRGGRNAELVLGSLAGLSRGLLLSIGTDGIDGASDAAGALLDEAAIEGARRLDPERALAENDAGSFFDALGTALRCGPTGTNVADLALYLPAWGRELD